jgi:hypothetical protein
VGLSAQGGTEEVSMKTFLKVATALAVVVGLNGSNAMAMQKPQESIVYFYDDEAHTNQVGGTLLYCDGTHTHWGSYSLYYEEYDFVCP